MAQRTKEIRLLQEEEAEAVLDAEKKENEFLASQSELESKSLKMKKASVKANIARLKKKSELKKRNGLQKYHLLKIKHDEELLMTQMQ